MFEVYILTPYVSIPCVPTFSGNLTSLSLGPVRDYGLYIVTTRPKAKRCMRLHPEEVLIVSPCPASSTKCHPKHGLPQLTEKPTNPRSASDRGADDRQALGFDRSPERRNIGLEDRY